jgi:hypothetical protein
MTAHLGAEVGPDLGGHLIGEFVRASYMVRMIADRISGGLRLTFTRLTLRMSWLTPSRA